MAYSAQELVVTRGSGACDPAAWMTRRWISRSFVTLAATCAAGGVAGCGGDEGPLRIAASTPALAELARTIGGEEVRVSDLTPAGGQPHGLVPTAATNAALQQANLVVYLGGGYQPKLQEAIVRLPREAARLDLLGAGLMRYPAPLDGVAGLPPLEAGAADPHVWLDPLRYRAMAGQLAGALGELDEDAKARFAQRASAEARAVAALAQEYDAALRGCTGTLLATHPAWGHLAQRYGLQTARVGGISPGATPRAATLRALASAARTSGARALVSDLPLPRRTVAAIKQQTGLEVVVPNVLEARTPEGGYPAAMRANLPLLAQAAGCETAPPTGQ